MSVKKQWRILWKKSILRFLRFTPFKLLTFGFFTYVLLGLVAVSLPWATKADISFVDNLFNVVSAMSTTGLAAGVVAERYSLFGQIVFLVLIQLGAIGYMTLTSCLILARGDQLSQTRIRILGVEFALPEGLEIRNFVVAIVFYTVLIESAGAFVLGHRFNALGIETPYWQGLFHSVSAFGTAGFSLLPNGLEPFRDDIPVNLTVMALCMLGAIGFIIPVDLWSRMTGKRKEITFTSKVILLLSAAIVLLGGLVYWICEGNTDFNNLLTAIFQIVQASSTAGFNTVPVSALNPATLVLMIFVMMIGASPSGTGGGIKNTTVSVMIGIVLSVLRGHPERITFMRRTIPPSRIFSAVAVIIVYIHVAIFTIFILCLTESASFLDLSFEAVSALGTVGLSTGITNDLTDMGKLILTATMFIGRIGPLTLGLAFLHTESNSKFDTIHADLVA